MNGLAKRSFELPFNNAYHNEFTNIAARREAELNGKYRTTMEQLGLPEGSPMHQYLKHNWDQELNALHQEHNQSRRNPREFVEKYRDQYLNKKVDVPPWNHQPQPEASPTPSRVQAKEEAAQARKEQMGIGLQGSASALGLAGAGAGAGYTGAQLVSSTQQRQEGYH